MTDIEQNFNQYSKNLNCKFLETCLERKNVLKSERINIQKGYEILCTQNYQSCFIYQTLCEVEIK